MNTRRWWYALAMTGWFVCSLGLAGCQTETKVQPGTQILRSDGMSSIPEPQGWAGESLGAGGVPNGVGVQ